MTELLDAPPLDHPAGPLPGAARHARRRPSTFTIGLSLISVVGLAIRAGWVIASRHEVLSGDASYYHFQANLLVKGHGFVEPFAYLHGDGAHPSAYHPPLFVLYLAMFSAVGLKSWLAHRLAACLVGTATISVIGCVGRRVATPRVGLVAALLAAVYPYMWINDGVLMSESIVVFVCAVIVVLSYRMIDRPSVGRAVVLGAACGLAALGRAEQILLVPVLVLPLMLTLRRRTWRDRVTLLAASAVAAALVLTPWTVRNLVTFARPVTLSTNLDPTLLVTNCPSTYDSHNNLFAFWDINCIASTHPSGDESQQATVYRRVALDFVKHHKAQAVVVAAARVGRLWNLYRPLEGARLDGIEGHPQWASHAGLALFALLVPLAGVGAVASRRRRVPLLPLLALPIIVTVTAALFYGNTRFRAPAEITIVVLAAVAVDALVTRSWPAPPRTSAPALAAPTLAAPTPSVPARFPCFDGYRALAALSVLVVHVTFLSGFSLRHHTLGNYTARLDIGVSVFFVISGFLLYRPYVTAHLDGRPGPALGPYLRRRLLRIVPAYWVALTLIAFVFHDTTVHGIKQIIVYYGFLQIYWGKYLNGGITQAWSLCTEMSFYLFLPLWAAAIRWVTRSRQARAVPAELVGIGMLYAGSLTCRFLLLQGLFSHRIGIVGALYWLPTTLDQFALGMALAVLSARAVRQPSPAVDRLGQRPWLWWTGAAVFFWLVATQIGLPRDLSPISTSQWMGREVLYGLFALLLIAPGVFGSQDRGWIRRALQNRALQAIGLVSYAVYLWHTAAIDEFHKRTHTIPFSGHAGSMLAFVLATTIVVAAISYVVVEKPALALKGRR